jgi:DNA-binding NarL/FixJ family response regulator
MKRDVGAGYEHGAEREIRRGLTARECDVLSLILGRATNRHIAEKLGCSLKTAEFHVSNILRKSGATSRAELMRAVATTVAVTTASALARPAGVQAEHRHGRARASDPRSESRARAASRTLTKRELSVFELLRAGSSNKDIALALGCSVRTAEYHVANVLRKTSASRRLSLIGAQANTLRADARLHVVTPVDESARGL